MEVPLARVVIAAPTGDALRHEPFTKLSVGHAAWVTPGQEEGKIVMLRTSLFAAAALALGMYAAPVSAAPLANVQGLETEAGTAAEPVHYRRYRRCWRHHGHWHCRRAHYRPYYYGYAPGYYSYGPRFGLYFGGHRRHWGHWGHRHRYW